MEEIKRLNPSEIDTSLFPRGGKVTPTRATLQLAVDTDLVEPVVVRQIGNKAFPRYQLLSGTNSLQVADRAGLGFLPAVILQHISDQEARAFVSAHLASVAVGAEVEKKLSPADLMQILAAIEETKRIRDERARQRAQAAEETRRRPPGQRRAREGRTNEPQVTGEPKVRRRDLATYKDLATERGLSPLLVSQLKYVKSRLSDSALQHLLEGRITLGHAKALARFPAREQAVICGRILARGHSVRKVEESARKRQQGVEDEVSLGATARDPNIVRMEQAIGRRFGWKAGIAFDDETKKGSVTFHFDSVDGFEYLMEALGINPRVDDDLDAVDGWE